MKAPGVVLQGLVGVKNEGRSLFIFYKFINIYTKLKGQHIFKYENHDKYFIVRSSRRISCDRDLAFIITGHTDIHSNQSHSRFSMEKVPRKNGLYCIEGLAYSHSIDHAKFS